MKNFLVIAVFSVVVAQAETNRLALTPKFINQLAEEARTNFPGMRAAEARVRAAGQNERSVKLWDDPDVMFGGAAISSSRMRMEEGDLVYGVEQKLPITGKPQAERAMARAETQMEEAAQELRFQTLRREIADAALKAALADEVLRISQQDQAWLQTMVTVTMEQYKIGRAMQTEILRMETEHATRAEQLRVAQKDRESELLVLNRLLNRPLTTAWPELELPQLAPELAPNERLLELATRQEPKLRVMRQDILRAESGAESARRARRPDFSLGADARQFSGSGEIKEGTVYLKMTIPWINRRKYDAAFRREKERADAARWEAADYENQVRDEISRLAIRIENARRQAVLYRDQIIPRSEQALVSVESTWRTGRSIFHEVLEARRLLLEGRLMYARAVAEQYRALAELVLCCGLGDLEAVELFQKIETQK